MSWTEQELIKLRQDLHQIPEIGLEEFKTQAYLLAVIGKLPQDKLEIFTQDTAILVRVKGKKNEHITAWRTDIDGLPVLEETGLECSSIHPGFMHACGHDFHMTIALGLLQKAVEEELKYDRVFFFQPAEENESGAKIYYDNNFLKQVRIDEFFGLHVAPHLKSNVIGTIEGTLFAGVCGLTVTFKGQDGHAAFPHQSNDMIVAASAFVQQVQTIVSRNINPTESSVVTLGEFHSGTASNIIAGTASLTGSMRSLTHEVNELNQRRLREIAEGVALSFDCEVEVSLDQKGYVPVVNDKNTTKDFIDYIKKQSAVTFEEVSEMMTGEDFGYLLEKYHGTMFWYGVGSEYGLHHGKFNPDESSLKPAVETIHGFLNDRDEKKGITVFY